MGLGFLRRHRVWLGERSQWYRNVTAYPRVRVSVGFRRDVPAAARPLTREAAEATLDRYAKRYPRTWRHLEPTLRAALHQPNLNLPCSL